MTRREWDALEAQGVCPECKQSKPGRCLPACRKYWFDYGFRVGFHDGANNLFRHDHAFLAELCENGEVDNSEDEVG